MDSPIKYRQYADRVENAVPIFKERITLAPNPSANAQCNFLSLPVIPGQAREWSIACPADVDEPETITDVVVDENADDIVADETIMR